MGKAFVRFSVLFIILLFAGHKILCSQNELTGIVVNNSSIERVKYCVITSYKTGETFLTNPEGVFRIPYTTDEDTLVFFALGFQSLVKPVTELRQDQEVFLIELSAKNLKDRPKIASAELFSYIKDAAKNLRKKPVNNSRAYLEYLSSIDNKDFEFSRFYYNVLVQGSKVLDMNIKHGRVSMAPNQSGLINLVPSKSLIRQAPVQNSKSFPANPLQPSVEKEGENLWDFVEGTHANSDSIIHIVFTKLKKDDNSLCEGEIWINKVSYDIFHLSLKSNNVGIHPFVGRPEDSITQVSIETNYHFDNTSHHRGKLLYIDFSYAFDFLSGIASQKNKNRIATEGLVHFYNFDRPFFIPRRNPSELYDDYFKAGMVPFDSTFWNLTNGLVLTQRQWDKFARITESGISYNYRLPKKDKAISETLFRQNNVTWNKDSYLDLDADESQDSIRADLSVYIYFDLNTFNDSLVFNTITILDRLSTKFNLEYNKQNLVFQNVYFDLCEIVRLNLDIKLKQLQNIEDMGKAHEVSMKDLISITGKFKKETNLGANIHKLKKWSDLVYDRTGVDNFKTFGLTYKPKKNK